MALCVYRPIYFQKGTQLIMKQYLMEYSVCVYRDIWVHTLKYRDTTTYSSTAYNIANLSNLITPYSYIQFCDDSKVFSVKMNYILHSSITFHCSGNLYLNIKQFNIESAM